MQARPKRLLCDVFWLLKLLFSDLSLRTFLDDGLIFLFRELFVWRDGKDALFRLLFES